MLISIIIAIWFGVRAHKCGKNIIGWALGGLVLTFIVNTVFANAALLLFTGSLTGRITLDIYITIRIIGALFAILAMIFVAKKFLSQKVPESDKSIDRFGETPQPLRVSYPVVLLVAILLPGVASLMLRGWKEVGPRSVLLFAAIPLAFLIFGPLWGEVIFATSTKAVQELGLWPFIATCVVVPIISLIYALKDRRIAIARLNRDESDGELKD